MVGDSMLSRRSVNMQYTKTVEDAFKAWLIPFIEANEDLAFYAIFVDVNLINGELNVALNTEFDYQRRKRYYDQNGIFVSNLRYKVDEWNYQGIVSVQPVEQEAFDTYYRVKPEMFAKMCIATIDAFMHENLSNFEGKVIVHFGDEDLNQSLNRYLKVCPLSKFAMSL